METVEEVVSVIKFYLTVSKYAEAWKRVASCIRALNIDLRSLQLFNYMWCLFLYPAIDPRVLHLRSCNEGSAQPSKQISSRGCVFIFVDFTFMSHTLMPSLTSLNLRGETDVMSRLFSSVLVDLISYPALACRQRLCDTDTVFSYMCD